METTRPQDYGYTPTVGGFNGDGLVEIAVTYGLSDISSRPVSDSAVLVYVTGQPFHPEASDWPMLHRDARHTSVLRRLDKPTVALKSLEDSVTSATLQFQASVFGFSGSPEPTGIVNLLQEGAPDRFMPAQFRHL